MKLLTLNFLTCAIKACKTSPDSFPLHIRDATLVRREFSTTDHNNEQEETTGDETSQDETEVQKKETENEEEEIHGVKLLRGMWDRLDWNGIRTILGEIGHTSLPEEKPFLSSSASFEEPSSRMTEGGDVGMDEAAVAETGPSKLSIEEETKLLKTLNALLIETDMREGKLVCGHCGHAYAVREGIANFLLPSHLVS